MKMRGKKKDPGWKLWNMEACRCRAFSINLPVRNTDMQVSKTCMCVVMESKRVTESPGKLVYFGRAGGRDFWKVNQIEMKLI